MVQRWLREHGQAATLQLLAHNNARPAYSIRINTARTTVAGLCARLEAAGASVQPSPYLPQEFIRCGLAG